MKNIMDITVRDCGEYELVTFTFLWMTVGRLTVAKNPKLARHFGATKGDKR